jgi:leucyl aminopeptidase (aminopeptidase T)
MTRRLEEAGKTILQQCMNLQAGESVLVVVDEPSEEMGQTLWASARELEAEATLIKMIARASHGAEPPPVVAKAMLEADIVLAPTSKSLSHTQARKAACGRGARVASMPTITEDIMARTMGADFLAIRDRTMPLAKILSDGSTARVTAPGGTDLVLSLRGREGHGDTGILHEPGSFGNLPAGEAYVAPMEGTAEGVIVFDGAMPPMGLLDEPITVVIKGGYATEIEGGEGARRLLEAIEPFGQDARNIGELGIGTNEAAGSPLTGNTLEDEKALGTIHFALGNSATIGGTVDVPSHIDGVIVKPTLIVDGKTVVEDGEFVV